MTTTTRLITGLLFACLVSAQTVQDFKCAVPASISNANPAVVTCPSPHGYNKRATVNLTFNGNAVNNDTLTIDGATYCFVTSLNNAVARQVLIGAGARDTTWNFYH